jgi:hypothetical protein
LNIARIWLPRTVVFTAASISSIMFHPHVSSIIIIIIIFHESSTTKSTFSPGVACGAYGAYLILDEVVVVVVVDGSGGW